MDSWYAAEKLMALIDKLEKNYYAPINKNLVLDYTGGKEKYQPIEQVIWSELEQEQGKLIKINKFTSRQES